MLIWSRRSGSLVQAVRALNATGSRSYRSDEGYGRRSDPYDSDSFDKDPYATERPDRRPRGNLGGKSDKFDVFAQNGSRGKDVNSRFDGKKAFGEDKFSQAGSSLGSINWSDEQLVPFEKDFYVEHNEIKMMSKEDVKRIMNEIDVTVHGAQPIPKPITQFHHCNFDSGIMEEIQTANYEKPSAIQCQAWPIAISGRDMIGVASTGSGKTLAFVLPALTHISAQKKLSLGEGPIALVLAPTRELATQIQRETDKFGRISGIRNTAVFGGVPRYEQSRDLRRGVEIVIATPGRLLDFLDQGVTNLKRITYLVLDEADRMLDMGFEPQIRKIVSQIRPDRQTLMFSATWPKEIQILARDFCREDPTKVTIGSSELQANPNIKQDVIVLRESEKKDRFLAWMQDKKDARILLFTETKRGADTLTRELRYQLFDAAAIHGDKEQRDRDRVLADFRSGKCKILVATDVAQRGIDVKDVNYVVNYDVPKTIEDYIHRIGRTGRAGASGTAVTFFTYDFYTPDKIRMAKGIMDVMRDVNQKAPDSLREIANQRR